MKKPFWKGIMVVASLVVALFSCSREAVETTPAATVQGAANCPDRIAFVTGKTHEQYMNDYGQLPPPHKKCMWSDKMDHAAQYFATNPAQVTFILQCKTLLTVSLFAQGSPPGFDDAMMAQAGNIFTFEEIARTFFVLHDINNPPPPFRPNAGGVEGGGSSGQPDCYCLWSVWCGGAGYCHTGGCTVRRHDCGFLGVSDCKGICEM